MRIIPIVKKWQPILEIQDGGGRHLEFRLVCKLNATFPFFVIFLTFPPNLVTIGVRVKKWQLIFETQDGGRRHLEFR